MMSFRRFFLVLLIALRQTSARLIEFRSNNSAADPTDNCPPLTEESTRGLNQEQFISKLTQNCRYDKLLKPPTIGPVTVYLRLDLTHIEFTDRMKFMAHMLVQYRYTDNRLDYRNISARRGAVLGEEVLRAKIWVPHLFLRNDKDTNIMGIDGRDIFVAISPNGEVIYSYRLTADFYCWMNLKKFPFDSQDCHLGWNSWTYNSTQLILKWDENPVKIARNLHLTEFILSGTATVGNVMTPASFNRGPVVGNYSELIFRFKLTREVGYYVMDYFLPSILLVCTSWVTFWLQADASPARTTIGTSTMLAFITLNGGLTKNLPKVSYIKASEIWFLGCAFFIFGSMAEFAFVNVIWRRRKEVELIKPDGKHILLGAITPSIARKHIRKAASVNSLYKSRSCSSLDSDQNRAHTANTTNNYLTVQSFSSLNCMPTITVENDEIQKHEDFVTTSIPVLQDNNENISKFWHTMSPQEVSIWIDRKSRVFFPVSFLCFNLLYWTFVYAL